jgi:hypothetical protein
MSRILPKLYVHHRLILVLAMLALTACGPNDARCPVC